MSFDRKRKKDSFYWYKANWNPAPMIYLANRRDSIRTVGETSIQGFSNLDQTTLTVNGKAVVGSTGVNNKHWVFTKVNLQKGENIISAKGSRGGQLFTDSMKWLLK